MTFRNASGALNDAELGEQAAEWFVRLEDPDHDPEDEFPDVGSRNQAFFAWLETSPEHLRVFLETVEVHRRLPMIDSRHVLNVENLLRQRVADIIPLRKEASRPRPPPSEPTNQAGRNPMAGLGARSMGKRLHWRALAAALLICAVGLGGYWWMREDNAYATKVGEQRSTKLEDGSFIYLNTDSRVEVEFSEKVRNVRLVRGEALFVVERDSSRPFMVTAGDTTVRVIGTQFNVRRREQGADVAVVEGAVQVTSRDAPEAQKLTAGEEAQVVKGRIAAPSRLATVDALAWRQRRLVFHDARLADVAEEFNRYNRIKIRIEGEAAQDTQLSGIFDADRPQALVLYAAKSAGFSVEPAGNDWVIKGR